MPSSWNEAGATKSENVVVISKKTQIYEKLKGRQFLNRPNITNLAPAEKVVSVEAYKDQQPYNGNYRWNRNVTDTTRHLKRGLSRAIIHKAQTNKGAIDSKKHQKHEVIAKTRHQF